jgi:hypothetical protein
LLIFLSQQCHCGLEFSDLILKSVNFFIEGIIVPSVVFGPELEDHFIELLNPSSHRKILLLIPSHLKLNGPNFGLVSAFQLFQLNSCPGLFTGMGKLIFKLLNFHGEFMVVFFKVCVLPAVFFELFEDFFVFGLELVFGVFFEVFKLFALFLEEVFEFGDGVVALFALFVGDVPLFGELLDHFFVHVSVEWGSLNFAVFMHVLLEVGVEAFDLCGLEEADDFEVLAHEYL